MTLYRRQDKGWVYNDCFMAHDILIEAEEQTFLGWPPETLPERYSWHKITLPKGKSWNKDASHFRDSEYAFSKISLFANGSDLYIKFTPSRGLNWEYKSSCGKLYRLLFKQSPLYLTIKNYSEVAAFSVIDVFRNERGEPLGRHFEDAIITFWIEHNLHLYQNERSYNHGRNITHRSGIL